MLNPFSNFLQEKAEFSSYDPFKEQSEKIEELAEPTGDTLRQEQLKMLRSKQEKPEKPQNTIQRQLLYESLKKVAGNPYAQPLINTIQSALGSDDTDQLKKEERDFARKKELLIWQKDLEETDWKKKTQRENEKAHREATLKNMYRSTEVASKVGRLLNQGFPYDEALYKVYQETNETPFKDSKDYEIKEVKERDAEGNETVRFAYVPKTPDATQTVKTVDTGISSKPKDSKRTGTGY